MRVYLDYNATTPVDRCVLDAMLPYFTESCGNASSIHTPGQRARAAVEQARESVAALIGAKPAEIVFTSGGTEADNLAILGVAQASRGRRRHIVTTAIEHHAVWHPCQALEREGPEGVVDVTYVRVGSGGVVDPAEIRRALRPETILISAMHANNELGTIQPIEEIGRIATQAGIPLHTDAVQSAGKLPLRVDSLGASLLSLSAHKIYGPKGVGALYVRAGTQIEPQFHGGHHERDRRPGTENVPGIVGFGKAAELALARLPADPARIAALRDRLESGILREVPSAAVNGDRAHRVANTVNFTFPGAAAEALVIALDLQGIACSAGAACSSGAVEPSHVLLAIGRTEDEARSSVRFSLGRLTAEAEIDYAISAVANVAQRLRSLSPHATGARA